MNSPEDNDKPIIDEVSADNQDNIDTSEDTVDYNAPQNGSANPTYEKPSGEVIDYVKSFKRYSVQGVAEEVMEARNEDQDRKRSVFIEIEAINVDIEAKNAEAEEISARIEAIKDEIARKKARLITQIFKARQIKDSEALIAELSTNKNALESMIDTLLDQVEEKDAIMAEDRWLDASREKWKAFFEEQAKNYEKYLENASVKNITERTGAVFVHAVAFGWSPGANSMVSPSASMTSKSYAVAALGPDISCSTIVEGETDRLWGSGVGLILNDGQVRFASLQDGATVASEEGERSTVSTRYRGEPSWQEIQSVALGRGQGYGTGYNEFIIRNPRVAGIYLEGASLLKTADDYRRAEGLEIVDSVSEISRVMGVPLFIIEKGVIYHAKVSDSEPRTVEKLDEVSREELLGMTSAGDDNEHQESITDNLLEDVPFHDYFFPEMKLLGSWDQGREIFIRSQMRKITETSQPIRDDGRYKAYAEFYGPRRQYHFGLFDGKPFFGGDRVNRSAFGNFNVGVTERWRLRLSVNGMDNGQCVNYAKEEIKPDIHTIIKYLGEQIEKMSVPGYIENSKLDKAWFDEPEEEIEQMSFALEGIAQMADEYGMTEIAEYARSMSKCTKEQVAELVNRRMGERGAIKATKEEIARFTKKF